MGGKENSGKKGENGEKGENCERKLLGNRGKWGKSNWSGLIWASAFYCTPACPCADKAQTQATERT